MESDCLYTRTQDVYENGKQKLHSLWIQSTLTLHWLDSHINTIYDTLCFKAATGWVFHRVFPHRCAQTRHHLHWPGLYLSQALTAPVANIWDAKWSCNTVMYGCCHYCWIRRVLFHISWVQVKLCSCFWWGDFTYSILHIKISDENPVWKLKPLLEGCDNNSQVNNLTLHVSLSFNKM